MTQNTVTQLLPAVGALVAVRMEDLTIHCRVLDVKRSWDRIRLQVQPLAGDGLQWVDLSRVVSRLDSPDCTCGEGNGAGLGHSHDCARYGLEVL